MDQKVEVNEKDLKTIKTAMICSFVFMILNIQVHLGFVSLNIGCLVVAIILMVALKKLKPY